MKKIAFAALALAVALPSMSFAANQTDSDKPPRHEQGFQGEHGPRDHKGPRDHDHGRFEHDLGLSDDQAQGARHEFHDGMRDRMSITAKYLAKLPKAEQEAMQAELKKSEDTHRDNFYKLLTPEQKTKALAFEKERAEHKPETGQLPVAK
jgi:Spy/CpxP family protein refolding chaperone